MKSFTFLFAIPLILLSGFSYSQTVFNWQDDLLILDNGAVKRTVEFSKEYQTVQTRSVFHGKNNKNFISENSSLEFSFEIDGVTYTGQDKWEYVKHAAARDNRQGEGVTVTIRGTGELSGLEIDIVYLLYPNLPLIRKYLTFRNRGTVEYRLESLDIENLTVNWGATHSWVYTNYARQKHLGTYVGNWDDPLVVVHDYRGRQGIALGNEAPGVTKRTAYHTVYDDISIGLTHSNENYAFRKWVQPNEEWTSPEVFIATYDNSPDASNVINSTVNDFTRKYMGIRLMEISEKPVFVYNTWNPFRHDINEQLIKDLADAVAECGIEEFIIDDGWQRNSNSGKDRGGPVGDWLINETKFPNGLSPVFNYGHL